MIRLQDTMIKPDDTSSKHLEGILARRLEDVLKTFWRRLEDVLKMSWRRLEDVLKTFLQDILKRSSKRLEDVFWRRMTKVNIFVLFKTSWRRLLKTKTKDIFKTSSRRLHQDECLLGRNYLTICMTCTKMKFCIKYFFSKCDQIFLQFGHIYWRNT